MTVTVLLFARYREAAGAAAIEIRAGEGATLADVWDAVRRRVPALAGEERPLMALDRAYRQPGTTVGDGAEVAFFPPVSGG